MAGKLVEEKVHLTVVMLVVRWVEMLDVKWVVCLVEKKVDL